VTCLCLFCYTWTIISYIFKRRLIKSSVSWPALSVLFLYLMCHSRSTW